MIPVSVTRWNGKGVEHLHGAWHTMPVGNVLWVWIDDCHRLLGADGYWVHGNQYGCTYEDAYPKYGGVRYMMWEIVDGEMRSVGEYPPPEGAYVIRGIELPDDLWYQILEEHS